MVERMTKSVLTTEADIMKAMKRLQRLKAEIISHFEAEELRLTSELDSVKSESKSAIQETSEHMHDVQRLSLDMLSKLDSEKHSPYQIFKASKQMKEGISNAKSIKDNIAKIVKQCQERIAFHPNSIFDDFTFCKQPLGEVVQTKTVVSLGDCNLERSNCIDICTFKDSKLCRVTGCVMISDDKVLIVDVNNSVLKLIDILQQIIISDLYMSKTDYLWDIAALPDKKAAVTSQTNKTIYIVSYRPDTLVIVRRLYVKGCCCGIDYRNRQLIVSYVDPPGIEIMDMAGNVFRHVVGADLRAISLKRPQYVVFSKQFEGMIISDVYGNTVTALDIQCQPLWTYSDRELIWPESLHITPDGNILVCGNKNNNIHLISINGDKIKVILKKEDGINDPFAAALIGRSLLVTGFGNQITLYNTTD